MTESTNRKFYDLLEDALLGSSLVRVQMAAEDLLKDPEFLPTSRQRQVLSAVCSQYNRVLLEDLLLSTILADPSAPENLAVLAYTPRTQHLISSPVEFVEPYLIAAYPDLPLSSLLPAAFQPRPGQGLRDYSGKDLLCQVASCTWHQGQAWVKLKFSERPPHSLEPHSLPVFWPTHYGELPGLMTKANFLAEPYRGLDGSSRLFVHRCLDFTPELKPDDSFVTLPQTFWELPVTDFRNAVAGT